MIRTDLFLPSHMLLCIEMCKGGPAMATNLAIDDELIEEARRIGGLRTKKAVVTEALREYIQHRKQLMMLDLFNTIEYAPGYDYKQQRKKA